MLIDWFTVGAQVLNFLILVWLLSHFLYKPILKAIDVREKSVAAERADIDAIRSQAQRERDDFQSKNKAFEEQRSTLFSTATSEAKAERERLLGEARNEGDGLRAKQENALRNDRTRMGEEITRLTETEVIEIARKTLADLATANLEERIVEVFTRRLHELDGKAKETLGSALRASPEPALVRTAFELPSMQKAAIQNALNETFSAEIRVRYETVRDVLCGIELTSNGQRVAWNIADYLRLLEQKVDALFEAQLLSAGKPTLEAGIVNPPTLTSAVPTAAK
jgi:F-type H+-transporting ATPase subunit b